MAGPRSNMNENGSELFATAHHYQRPRLNRRRFRLRIEVGAGPLVELVSGEERTVVGCHPGANLVVADNSVSRFHFEIVRDEEGHLLRDLGSTNGTEIAGIRVREAYLQQRTRIQIGRSQLSFMPLGDADAVRLQPGTRFGAMVASSPIMLALFERLERIALRDTTLLLEGESGTGKELAARAVHDSSPRRDGPFVVVDCASIPRTLIEAELFGHERGAFTGATQARAGAFVRASSGTIFLDEIGELDLDLQPRLLGALERREIKPIGSPLVVPIDVRVISATNRNLRREVQRKTFREDLYYRLAVACITMPPLRERPGDISLLVDYFLDQHAALDGRRHRLEENTLLELATRSWPGNLRELRNCVEQLVAFGDEQHPTTASVGALTSLENELPIEPFKVGKARAVERFEAEYLARVLAANNGRITASAIAAEVNRVHFLRLLDKHSLRKPRHQ
jgi:transcriptional regulator with PAS, ATPase and Fis domain